MTVRIRQFMLIGLWVSALVAASDMPALAEDTILPGTVIVDATGSDAVDAKNQAMAKAEKEAFEQILRKFNPDVAPDIIARTPPDKLSTYVRGIEVLDEKISGNRYRATLKVNFSGDGIERLLDDASKPPPPAAAGGNGGVLVLPVFRGGDTPLLWENKNSWRAIFSRAAVELGKGMVVVPFGDNDDGTVVTSANIAGAGYDALVPLLQRYGTGDAVVMTASFSGDAAPLLTVHQRSIGKTLSEVSTFTYHADDGESRDDMLKRAARELAGQLAARRAADRDMAAMRNAPGTPQMIIASISTLAAWNKLREAIASLPMVRRTDVLAMAPRQVDMMVYYTGDAQTLADAMQVKGLRLVKQETYWVVARD